MTFRNRLRVALGVLFDSTNWREIQRRPSEPVSVRTLPEEVTTDDRLRLVSDSRKLYANLGPAKGAIDAKAMYAVGRSWLPRFEGEDKAWGEEARAWLLDEWYPMADINGRDFQTALYLASVSVDRDGDIGGILTEYDTKFPAIQLVPCNLIGTRDPSYAGNPYVVRSGLYKGMEENDGVVVNDLGRPVAYRVLGADSSGKDDQYISARDMALLFEPQWAEQTRGLPGFAHAILDLKDLRTVQGYEKMASALASSIGLIEHSETGLADVSDPAFALNGGVVNSSADVVGKEIFGGMVRHFKAGSGAKLEAFKSDRPGDAWDTFMNRLIRNAMAGINWPYELAWDISALGGANTRFVIASAMRTVEDRQDLLKTFAKRAVGYAVSKAVKLGKVPPSPEWYKWGFTLPPRMTADFGRDAQAQREDYLNGIINLTDICAERGEDIDVHIRERAEENEKLEDAGLPYPGSWGEIQTEEVQKAQAGGMAPGANQSNAQNNAQTSSDPTKQEDPNDPTEDDSETDTVATNRPARGATLSSLSVIDAPSAEIFRTLKSGTIYRAPDGNTYTKS